LAKNGEQYLKTQEALIWALACLATVIQRQLITHPHHDVLLEFKAQNLTVKSWSLLAISTVQFSPPVRS
jgi:hypothetical protein